jgi:hypothetical protein
LIAAAAEKVSQVIVSPSLATALITDPSCVSGPRQISHVPRVPVLDESYQGTWWSGGRRCPEAGSLPIFEPVGGYIEK